MASQGGNHGDSRSVGGEGRVVGDIQLDSKQREQRLEQSFGLTPRKSEDEAKLKREGDRGVGVPSLATAATILAWSPGLQRIW